MDTIFNVLSGWRKVGSPGAYCQSGSGSFAPIRDWLQRAGR